MRKALRNSLPSYSPIEIEYKIHEKVQVSVKLVAAHGLVHISDPLWVPVTHDCSNAKLM